MSASIIACPECNTLLLDDTAQCPSCRHVLNAQSPITIDSSETSDKEAQSTTASNQPGVQDSCPGCGELVRRGLVRCWNCGSFMRDDIADSYQRMRSEPAPVIYSPLPEGEAENDDEQKSSPYQFDESEKDNADDDFELAPDVIAEDEDFEDDFDISPNLPNQVFDEVEQAYHLIQEEDEAKSQEIAASELDETEEKTVESDTDGSESEDDQKKADRRAEFEEEDEDHSIATGGDVLLKVALEEEAESGRRRMESGQRQSEGSNTMAGIVVFCPNGHRVEVQERHRGKTGRCPRCREMFFVPAGAWHEDEAESIKKPETDKEVSETSPDQPYKVTAGEYSYWMRDVHLHSVDISKLKLKPGSLEKTFELLDLACAPFGMLIISLIKKKAGLFASSKKQEPSEIRETAIEHLSDERLLDELPVGEHSLMDADDVQKIRIVQPAPTEYESMFAGIPVFGQGRIAVRFPKQESDTDQKFASFTISGFRIFAEALSEVFDMEGYGSDCDVPLTNAHTELKCHYSEETFLSLEQIEYYQADSAYELKLVGRKCQECGLVVSEDSRKKEKLGGANGRGIAKAKCPKCTKKFGNISLFAIEKGPAIGAETEMNDTHSGEEPETDS